MTNPHRTWELKATELPTNHPSYGTWTKHRLEWMKRNRPFFFSGLPGFSGKKKASSNFFLENPPRLFFKNHLENIDIACRIFLGNGIGWILGVSRWWTLTATTVFQAMANSFFFLGWCLGFLGFPFRDWDSWGLPRLESQKHRAPNHQFTIGWLVYLDVFFSRKDTFLAFSIQLDKIKTKICPCPLGCFKFPKTNKHVEKMSCFKFTWRIIQSNGILQVGNPKVTLRFRSQKNRILRFFFGTPFPSPMVWHQVAWSRWARSGRKCFSLWLVLLMAEILHQLIGSLTHYSRGFIHPRWCRISSINSMWGLKTYQGIMWSFWMYLQVGCYMLL